ncbi:hypothetical protein OTK59_03725 [Vibrio natriegens]|uniref:hypothetical protein n=1 Tax=Vibrio natriegens TaxID=691 RepID=UPI000803E906|nr:hypothetical protein [Vibrio natriegens]ANQ28086.1 hypothetical protein BA894_16695 [Vibrio natriegens]MCY9875658.1 hypothetical protein [Vibrio natriegens]
MKTRITKVLVVTGLAVLISYFPVYYSYAATSPNCNNILATNRTSVSQKMVMLLGQDITKSNHITTVIPTAKNPFVTEELVSVSNDVSPNGRYPKRTLNDIQRMRSNLNLAAKEAERLKGTYELALISLIDGYCQFSNNKLTQHAKIDFDHLEGLTLYSIPALIAMADQSYAMFKKQSNKQPSESNERNNDQQNNEEGSSAVAAASYQNDNVMVKVEDFDGSNVTFSVTNIGAEGELEPQFNTFSAYRNESGNLLYRPESLLSIEDNDGNSIPTIGIAELSSHGSKHLSISPGETRTFVTQLVQRAPEHAQLSIEFPAKALNTEQPFSLSFTDLIAIATADIN